MRMKAGDLQPGCFSRSTATWVTLVISERRSERGSNGCRNWVPSNEHLINLAAPDEQMKSSIEEVELVPRI